MTRNTTTRNTAIACLTLWPGNLFAGADDPPPPGFWLIILLDFMAAWLVYLRLPSHVTCSIARMKKRLLRVFLDVLDGSGVGIDSPAHP
jgi:hypothetical protein